jgi:hypothetical protein
VTGTTDQRTAVTGTAVQRTGCDRDYCLAYIVCDSYCCSASSV